MTLAQFARMCEVLENQTPTEKARTISESLSSFKHKGQVIFVLSAEYANNNIASKKASKWIQEALGLFEDEVNNAVYTWGDLGEAVFEIDEGNETDSDISMTRFIHLLEQDCSSINNSAFTLISEALSLMSAREKKWFVRYWVRTPRNGCKGNVPLVAMSEHFGVNKATMKTYSHYNSNSEICIALQQGIRPSTVFTHGQFVSPMLAKVMKDKTPVQYYIDVKYDGNRYQIHKKGESIIIFNRKGKVVTDQFPDVVTELYGIHNVNVDGIEDWDEEYIIDTEIYPVNADGSPAEHKLLGKRVHKTDKAEAVRECPVKVVAFDMLSWNGKSFLDDSLRTRLANLTDALPDEYIAKSFPESTITAAYNQAISLGFEGVMVKDMNMSYEPGKRSSGWLKHKPPRFNYDVVITSAEYGEGKRNNVYGSFGICVKDGSEYVSVGRVGTGFSDADLTWLTSELRKLVTTYENNNYNFLPRLVLEVTCDLVTNDADGNIGLRFPRCLRIRHDKHASDIDTLDTLKEAM